MKLRSLLILSILGLAVGLRAETPPAPVPAKDAFISQTRAAAVGEERRLLDDLPAVKRIEKELADAKAQIAQLTKEKEELVAQLQDAQRAFAVVRQQRNELATQVLDQTGQQAMHPPAPPSTPNK